MTKEEVKNVHFIEIDLSNLDDVRKGCDEILERFKKPINSLICNAAVYKPRLKRPERSAPVSYTHLTLPTIYSV